MSFFNNVQYSLFKFNALSFSGAYRFYLLYLSSLSLDKLQIFDFSHDYIFLMFFTSFVGFPCAAMLLERNSDDKILYLVILALLLSVCSIFFIFIFTDKFFLDSVLISVSFFLSSVFEIFRQALINQKKYDSIFILSAINYIAVTFCYLLFFKNDLSFFLLFSMFLLTSTSLIFIGRPVVVLSSNFELSLFINKFLNNLLSCLTSTSVNYFIPLLVISIIGASYAPSFAFMSSVLGLALLIPRYLSNDFIDKIRSGVILEYIFSRFIFRISFVVILILCVTLFSLYLSSDNYSLYLVIFSAGLICSQFSLPYSNVFSVFGRPDVLMKINVLSFALLTISILLVYFLTAINAVFILSFYLIDQFVKLCLSIFFYKKLRGQGLLV